MAVQTITATIQMRHGDEEDFDPSKMTTGEWAVSEDAKYVRMCFAPGLCLRMATYEAFEEDMTEIQTILATCQNIQVAVEAFEKLAEQHASQAEEWSVASQSWAVGGTSTREGEDTNNSKYWSQQAKSEADRAKNEADRAASIADFDPDNYFSFSGGTEIQSGEDLNNVTTVGNYFCRIDQAVKTLLNCPVTKVFNMKVFYGTGNFILTQMIRCYDGEILFRYQKGNGEWQSWEHAYEPMKGATASAAGKEGLAPAPVAGKQNAYLRGDGTWVTPSTNLLGTVPGIPLDQTMGKQLKDELNSQNLSFANSIDKLSSNLSGLSTKMSGIKTVKDYRNAVIQDVAGAHTVTFDLMMYKGTQCIGCYVDNVLYSLIPMYVGIIWDHQ